VTQCHFWAEQLYTLWLVHYHNGSRWAQHMV
jgi:hypothetical protein